MIFWVDDSIGVLFLIGIGKPYYVWNSYIRNVVEEDSIVKC